MIGYSDDRKIAVLAGLLFVMPAITILVLIFGSRTWQKIGLTSRVGFSRWSSLILVLVVTIITRLAVLDLVRFVW